VGQVMYEQFICNTLTDQLIVDVSYFPQGAYILTVAEEERLFTKKIIVEHHTI